ncbi:LysM peptidoglycan-binding domain-containing protein [Deinococcus alpinitundrae]|uniref:LysM peptidoglycan-binding domain-containing protein n=1 Tax=Deinococcus alpinitundrae TaxID=468913 RepID=UPI001ED94842|nr:LysM peptidoglycan-binding domain-containing protein [Deinococcus alpinitundrae]
MSHLTLRLSLVFTLLGSSGLAAVTVKSGDTLFRISQRTGVSVARLRSLNGLSSNLISPGQVLNTGGPSAQPLRALPKPATKHPVKFPVGSASKPAAIAVAARRSMASRYTVRPGDTLGRIAGRGGVSVAVLQAANRLSGTLIRVGQVLVVPPPGSAVSSLTHRIPALPPTMEARTVYTYTTVGVSDTFVTLAKTAQLNAKLTPAQFMTLNRLSSAWVYPGMKVLLPRRVPVPIPPRPRRRAVTLSAMRMLGIKIQVVRVDLRHRDVLVSPVLPRRGIGSSARVSILARLSGAAAVINGSYFHPQSYIPAGDLVVQGKRLSWGRIPVALSITPDNRARIGGGAGGPSVGSGAGSQWSGMETVVASGPQIVRGGALTHVYSAVFQDPALFGRAARSAVGLSSNRDLLMVSTHERLTISEMGKIMARLGAQDALLLDGGSSAGLSWNNLSVLDSVRSVAYGIGVFPGYGGRRYSRS